MPGNINKKNKRKSISLKTKIEILDLLAKGQGSTYVGKMFSLNEATIRTIKRNEIVIRRSVASGTKISAKFSSYTRDSIKEKMEKALIVWIEDLTQKRVPVDGNTIKQKARRIYKRIEEMEPCSSSQITENNTNQFSASTGWLTKFLKRYEMHNVKIKGEIASGDKAAADEYPAHLAKLIKEGEYRADQVFNADETGLFWKRMPTRTYVSKAEKTAGGFKASKDRVRYLVCSNASGDRILKPLLINRALRPRAMKGVNLDKLPVHWKANRKAWMTASLFTEWFHDLFIPEVRRYLRDKGLPFKVLLIVDNAPGHPDLEHPNVKVEFLPPNTTSLIQPLDQGIISTFKAYYIKRTFQYILESIEDDETLSITNAWKKFSILDCVKYAAIAVSRNIGTTCFGAY